MKKTALFILCLIAFLDWMGIGLVYPMFSSMLFHRDIALVPPVTSDAVRGIWLGILLALMPLSQFFCSPIMGMFSDQKGRKPLLKICLLMAVVGYAVAATAVWSSSLFLLLSSRIILGVSAGSAAVATAGVADLSKPQEKAKNFGLLSMAAGIGFTVGPFLGGKLSVGGYDKPFIFAGILSGVNFLLLITLFRETHLIRKKVALSIAQGIHNLKRAFHLKGIRILFLSIFIFCFGWSFYWEFIPVTWINRYSMSVGEVGNLYAYSAAFYSLSSGLLIRPIVNRIKPTAVLFFHSFYVGFIFSFCLSTPVGIFYGGFCLSSNF